MCDKGVGRRGCLGWDDKLRDMMDWAGLGDGFGWRIGIS